MINYNHSHFFMNFIETNDDQAVKTKIFYEGIMYHVEETYFFLN